VRYKHTGSLDPSFGSGGVTVHDVGGDVFDAIVEIALQANGKIVVLGAGSRPRPGTSTSSSRATIPMGEVTTIRERRAAAPTLATSCHPARVIPEG
jgi:hypothetical protein